MRMSKRLVILGVGIALYAIGMSLFWLGEQSTFGRAPSEWANHEEASVAFVLAGVCAMLLGAILLGLKLTIGRLALGGTGIILLAVTIAWLWGHGVDVLAPNLHGWSAGFILLPLLMLAIGSAWLLMAAAGTLRHYWKRQA